MCPEGLINVCQAVAHGEFRQVTNVKTGKQGVVVDIKEDKLVVQAEQASEVWAYEDCE
jgi:hypothetical protein